jgi:hypothetical protein
MIKMRTNYTSGMHVIIKHAALPLLFDYVKSDHLE